MVLLRHLETLLAIAEEGSFTAAADALNTVQSNVSDQVRQLEQELGVPLLVRGRRGAEPTEFGAVVLDRARRVQRELDSMRADLSMLQGLEAGHAKLGVVGTASRWLVPALAADLRLRVCAPHQRGCRSACSRRCRGFAQAVVASRSKSAFVVDHLLRRGAAVGPGVELGPGPVELAAVADLRRAPAHAQSLAHGA
jgi:molybdenum-dependent DNA-binding transcriptional regulator ModE